MNSKAALERVSTLGVVGHDEDNWGVGVSGVVDNPSPFPRVNRLRDWFLDEYPWTIDSERALLETDAPYLTPVPYRGRPNAPCYLPFIAEQVARTMQVEVEELLGQVYRNSQSLFFESN